MKGACDVIQRHIFHVTFLVVILFFESCVAFAQDTVWTTKSPMPTPRTNIATAVVNNTIYAIGGSPYVCGITDIVEAYDPISDQWTEKARMPTPRDIPAAGVANGKIYVFGGTGSCNSIDLTTVEEYDPSADTVGGTPWATKTPMKTLRLGFAIAVVNEKIYLIGGASRTAGSLSTMEEYDPSADTVGGTPWTTKASMAARRSNLVAGVVNNKIYAIGGECTGEPSTIVEEYDPNVDSWTIKGIMPTMRTNYSASTLDGKIYVVGGLVEASALQTIEAYNPATNTWASKEDMPTPRWSLGTAGVNGKIYAIGGVSYAGNYSDIFHNEMEAFDIVSPDLPTPETFPTDLVRSNTATLTGTVNPNDSTTVAYFEWGMNSSLGTFSSTAPQAIGAGEKVISVKENLTGLSPNTSYYYRIVGKNAAGIKRGRIFSIRTSGGNGGVWLTRPPIPTVRVGLRVAELNGLLYTVGGSNAVGGLDNSLEVYDPVTNQWTRKSNMPTPRSSPAVGVINGKIYVAGGYPFTTALEVYDPAADNWSVKTSMPLYTATETQGAVVNGILYVIGGNAGGYCSNTVLAYNPAADTVGGTPWTISTHSMPTARCHLAVAALNGLIYAMGGTNTLGNEVYDVVEVFNPSADTSGSTTAWTTVASLLNARHDGFAACGVNGVLYAVGGSVPGGELTDVESYDPVTNVWSRQPSLPFPRSQLGVGAVGGQLFAIGGYNQISGLLAATEALALGAAITGKAFNDLNADSTREFREPDLEGWKISLGGDKVDSATTDANGNYFFSGLPAGHYTVRGSVKAGWSQTLPGSGTYDLTLDTNQVSSDKDFGNFQTSPPPPPPPSPHTKTWTAAVNCQWYDDDNWDPPGVPVTGDTVIVPATAQCALVIPPAVSLGKISIAEGATVRVQCSVAMTVTGDVTIDGSLLAEFDTDADPPRIEVQGNWYRTGTFGAGTSTVTFDGAATEQVQGTKFYNVRIGPGIANNPMTRVKGEKVQSVQSSANVITNGSWIIDGTIKLDGNLDARNDTIVITNIADTAVSGPGLIIHGTVQRSIRQDSTAPYRFESNDTYIQFYTSAISPSQQKTNPFAVTSSVPSFVAMTEYPDSSVKDVWRLIQSHVDPLRHAIIADTISHFSRWAIGVIKPYGIYPEQSAVQLDSADLLRFYDITADIDSGFLAQLSLRYDTLELRRLGATESSLKLFRADTAGTIITGIGGGSQQQLPKEFALEQNYPNPFNPLTIIRYQLPVKSHVTLRVYNILGQAVRTLINEMREEGFASVSFDAGSMASGVYFYKIEATSLSNPRRSFSKMNKMLLIR